MAGYSATTDYPTEIATNAYHLVGISTATAAELTMGENYLEWVLGDIANRARKSGRGKIKSLEKKRIQITTNGCSIYPASTDMDEEINLTILDGTYTGLVGSASSGCLITFSTCQDFSITDAEEAWFLCTSGTGVNEFHEIIDYAGTSATASLAIYQMQLATSWSTTLAGGDSFLIVDEATELDEENVIAMGNLGISFSKGKPSSYCKIVDDGVVKYMLDRPCDTGAGYGYGLMERFYADILKLDTTGVTRNKIYLAWEKTLTYGVAAEIALGEDDNKYQVLNAKYETGVADILEKEAPYSAEFEGFEL